MFAIDLGNDTGESGPWLSWSARGTTDGIIPPRSFFIRDANGKTPFDMSKGVVLDLDSLKTGWQFSDGIAGVAPDWKWNPSPAQMMASPGEGYKKGFSVRCAIGGGNTATWQQAGAAAWTALAELAPQLSAERPHGHMPLVRLKDAKLLQFKKGSTVVPALEVVKWVPKPDCLASGGGIALEPATPAPAPAPAPQPAPTPQYVPDDAEF